MNNLKSGDQVELVRTGSKEINGIKGHIVGIASRGIFTMYIIELEILFHPITSDFKDFGPVKCVTMPESCLERI